MRLFVGIDVTDAISARIAAFESKVDQASHNRWKWQRIENLHVTLKYIGEFEPVESVRAALATVQADAFAIAFREIGFFTPRKPRICFATVHAEEALAELAKAVESALQPLGVRRDEQGYRPHLTLCRTGSGRPSGTAKDGNAAVLSTLKSFFDAHPELAAEDFGTMTANEFHLYRSETHPQGARYTKLQRYPLS